MATIAQITYDVREKVQQYTDDSDIDDRFIIYLLNNYRSEILRQQLNNLQRTTDVSIRQTLCLKLKEVNSYECDLNYDCDKLMRTTVKIPIPIELHTKIALTQVKPTKRLTTPFNFVEKHRAVYALESDFPNGIYSFLDPDGYIYLLSNDNSYKMLECLTIEGIFSDPTELENFVNCCKCDEKDVSPCFDPNKTNYPLQPHLLRIVVDQVVQQLLRKLEVPQDRINNSTDV